MTTTHGVSDDELRAFLEGRAPAVQQPGIEAHLADCHDCRHRMLGMHRDDEVEPRPLPEALRETARRLGNRRLFARMQFWLPVAALLTLLFGTMVAVRTQRADAPADHRVTRGQHSPSPVQTHPPAGAHVAGDPVALRWARVAEAVGYEVRVLDATGSIVLQRSTDDLQMSLDRRELRGAGTYFWYVVARFSDGRTLESQARAIEVEP